MPDPIATLFHVTDMHLSVDMHGDVSRELPSARLLVKLAQTLPVPSARSLLGGAMRHDEEALLALCEELPARVHDERDAAPDGTPVVVLQTGDVEAVGSAAPPDVDGYSAFQSWGFVHDQLRTDPDFWVDIYGNHDTWPGTYPSMRWRHRAINRERIATVPGLEGPWPGVALVFDGPAEIPVVVARVNTVSRRLLEETLASGTVTDHPPGAAGTADVLDDLAAAFEPWEGQRAVRIAIMHHPPHIYDANGRGELTTGRLVGVEKLARRLGELRVQLVIAGHRHKLNPPLEATSAAPHEQRPLASPTVQLVAETPTQDSVAPMDDDSDYERLQSLSFCRYRVLSDGDSFDVERTVFRYTELGGTTFSRETTETVFEGLPLD